MPRHWHLPGLETPGLGWTGETWYEGETPGGARFSTPRLSRPESAAVADTVRTNALRARRERSLSDVVKCISGAAMRLTEAEDPAGATARRLLGEELGWSAELVTETLAGSAAIWSEEALRTILAAELPDQGVLDGFREGLSHAEGPARRRRAVGPSLSFVVHAGNVPGMAVTAAIRGLLVRSGLLCKTPRSEPGLLPLFLECVEEADPLLGRSAAATWWPSDADAPLWDAWTQKAGKIVLYGGDEAVRGVRRRMPGHADLVVYGPRIGIAVLLPDADPAASVAESLARDVCAYEQQGCVSPRIAYVMGDAGRFAERLATAMAEEVRRADAPPPAAGTASAIRSARAELEFRSYADESEAVRVLGEEDDLRWTVLLHDAPTAKAEALPRVVSVCPVSEPGRLEETLSPLEGRIQSIGYAGREGLEELAELAATLGVSRLAPVGAVAWPPADWRHDGRHQLLPLLRWTDWE